MLHDFCLVVDEHLFDPANYRGVYLWVQLPTVVEQIVGRMFLDKLQCEGSSGKRPSAYSLNRWHRDALVLFVLSWLSSLESWYLVRLYCSNVSGAFDMVNEERLTDKLRRLGLYPQILGLLLKWLEPRTSVVVIKGIQRSVIETSLEECQSELHLWGSARQILFDAAK